VARIIIRCQHTGHYVFTGIETQPDSVIVGGRLYCPYCETEHVWTCQEARYQQAAGAPNKPVVRQAG
jgi:hypothetical protein